MVKDLYKKAKNTLLDKYRDSIVLASYDSKVSFLFTIKPKSFKDDEYVLDGFFKVDKNSNEISEYSPVMDPEEFKEFLKHRIE